MDDRKKKPKRQNIRDLFEFKLISMIAQSTFYFDCEFLAFSKYESLIHQKSILQNFVSFFRLFQIETST